MNFSRFAFLMSSLLFFMGCSGENTARYSEVNESLRTENADSAHIDSALEARVAAMLGIGYPKLTNENVEGFLQKWGEENSIRNVILETKHGDIELELFQETPIHSLNFLYKIHRQYYTETEFTRVVPEFVIQGGNSEEETPQQRRFLIGQHTLMPEFSEGFVHVRGSLAMSRSYSNNPEKKSSSYDFYIVTGRRIGDVEIAQVELEKGIKYSEAQKKAYREIGGAPHLDGEHTVFGRVVRGMDVAVRISETPKDNSDWPLEKLGIKMRVVE
jgi:peptidyl-prolyl cis-trans isomerase B (cyclophilin B)